MIMVFCEPSDVRGLWDRHLMAIGKDIWSFPFSRIDSSYDATSSVVWVIYEEDIIHVIDVDENLSQSINVEQMAAYETTISTIDSPNGGVVLVDGPRGI
jgi:hypothetical protein